MLVQLLKYRSLHTSVHQDFQLLLYVSFRKQDHAVSLKVNNSVKISNQRENKSIGHKNLPWERISKLESFLKDSEQISKDMMTLQVYEDRGWLFRVIWHINNKRTANRNLVSPAPTPKISPLYSTATCVPSASSWQILTFQNEVISIVEFCKLW